MAVKTTEIISHWSTMIQGLQMSPKEFFAQLESRVNEKQINNIKFSTIEFKEGGLLSAKRQYLRVTRGEYAFDLCGAPFGNGFFMSWWLGEIPSGLVRLLASIPGVSVLVYWYLRIFKTQTYYKHDTAQMFQSLVHSAVMEVVDEMTTTKALRALTDDERKPTVRDFFSS